MTHCLLSIAPRPAWLFIIYIQTLKKTKRLKLWPLFSAYPRRKGGRPGPTLGPHFVQLKIWGWVKVWRKRKEKIGMLVSPEHLSTLCLGYALCLEILLLGTLFAYKGCLLVGEQGRSRKSSCFNLLAWAFDNKSWMCWNPGTHPPAY